VKDVMSKAEGLKPSTSDKPGRGRLRPGARIRAGILADEAGSQLTGTGGCN